MRATLDSVTLKEIGLRAIALIRKRTLDGIDANDHPFAAYSSKPFVLPLAALQKGAAAKLKKAGSLTIFQTKAGATWALVGGGYLSLREAMGKQTSPVNLSLRGTMLRSLTVIKTDEAGQSVEIGFTDADSAEKAYYHTKQGAGKGRTIRDFFGLAPSDLSDDVLGRLLGAASIEF